MDEHKIRMMRPEDYDQVVRLWQEAGLVFRPRGRDSREEICRQLTLPSSIYFVIEEGEEIVASALCTEDGRKGWINRMAVRLDRQGRGLAKVMIAEAERRFQERDLHVYSCLIYKDNARSLHLFRDMGYEEDPGTVYVSKRSSKES